MRLCSNADCAWEGDGRFCSKCGKQMIEKPKDDAVYCNGLLEDGTVCNAVLTNEFKFCNNCGNKVDKNIFKKNGQNVEEKAMESSRENEGTTVKDSTVGDTEHETKENVLQEREAFQTANQQSATGKQSKSANQTFSTETNDEAAGIAPKPEIESRNNTKPKAQEGSDPGNKTSISETSEKNEQPTASNLDVKHTNVASIKHKDVETKALDTSQTQSVSGKTPTAIPKQAKQNKSKTKKDEKKKKSETPKIDKNAVQLTCSPGEKMVHLHFHALLSEDFKFCPGTDLIVLRSGSNILGGWQSKTNVLKITGVMLGTCVEVEYECDLPYSIVQSGFFYKYCILKQTESKELYELYMNDVKSNRWFYFPNAQKDSNLDAFHRFDGVINREPEGYVSRYLTDRFSRTTRLKNDCEQFVQHFTTNVIKFENARSLKENIILCNLLLFQLNKMYQIDANVWNHEENFKSEIGHVLLHGIATSVKQSCQDRNVQRMLTASFTFVLVMKENNLYNFEMMAEDLQEVCKALLVHPCEEKKTCLELEFIHTNYPDKRARFRDAVLSFMEFVGCSKGKDPCWMLLLPLVHFLTDMSNPFELPKTATGHDDIRPIWWGKCSVNNKYDSLVLETFSKFTKKDTQWIMPLETVMNLLQPLFCVDYLLPRSFMASLNLIEVQEVIALDKVPIYVCLATLNFFLKTPSYKEKVVYNCLDLLYQSKSSVRDTGKHSSAEILMNTYLSQRVAADVVKTSLSHRDINSQPICVKLFLHMLSNYDDVYSTFYSIKDHESLKLDDPENCTEHPWILVLNWLGKAWKFTYRSDLLKSLQHWNKIMASDDIPATRIKEVWNSAAARELTNQLNSFLQDNHNRTKEFIQVYCNYVDSFCSCMQEVLSQLATSAVETGYSLDISDFQEREKTKIGNLLSSVFMNKWRKAMTQEKKTNEEKILDIVLRWAPFPSFLSILNTLTDRNKEEMLSQSCSDGIVAAISVVSYRTSTLLTGEINVKNLKELQTYADKFATVVDLIKSIDESGVIVTKAIQLRCKEMDEVQTKADLVTRLTSVIHPLHKVDISILDAALAKIQYIDHYQVNGFCKPLDAKATEAVEQCQPIITAFSLPTEIEQILVPLSEAFASSLFKQLWYDQCIQQKNECTSLEDIANSVWQPVNASWFEIISSIESGGIRFSDMERHVGKTYRENYEDMKNEMLVMKISETVADERIKQLQQYRQLETSVKGAKEIMELARQYDLKGDFEPIRNIASHENVQMEMKLFDESLMDTCRILKDITSERSECIGALIKSDPLVRWLKESMQKGGLKELKVFVDLALISAGEQPMDIDRIQGLNTAVLGYSPIIFDLKPDADYNKLLEKCKLVWNELESIDKLPKKLIDSSRHVEWLKAIQKAHGSVEVSSLAQAEAINSTGVYTIGYIKNLQTNTALNRSKVLTLVVRAGEKDGLDIKTHSFEQLQDLQSRLMLVAGRAEKENAQGKDDVETFTEVYDGAKRLSTVYIKLYDAGCVLFKNWHASFICDHSRPVCAILEFGQGVEKLKGRRTEQEDTGVIIRKVARFLERCLDDWLDYISKKRNTFLHLNYFTTDQLVHLQRELVKIGTDEEPSLTIYPLLSAVKKECTPADLLDAVDRAQQQINERDVDVSDDGNIEQQEDDDEDLMRQTFIREMTSAGYKRPVAIKALEVVRPDQVDEGIDWCMEHDSDSESDMDPEVPEVTEIHRNIRCAPKWTQSESTVLSMFSNCVKQVFGDQKECGVEPLIKSLESLWKTFIGSISSNLKDYVSLEHLGLILKNLSEKCTFHVDRTLLKGDFKTGVPNLVIVPTEDAINTVLTIYMMDDKQPLPQPDEVLYCNQECSLDEVDIFWRRAIFDSENKIHCLVNADQLNYDVSDNAEKLLECYIEEARHKELTYRLVVICGSDNEYRSRIVSALERYKRAALTMDLKSISRYLVEKFQVTDTPHGIIAAANVDFNKCSVRVVKSRRAGVGKTLYKQRLEKQLGTVANGHEHGSISVPLQTKKIDLDAFIKTLLKHTNAPGVHAARIVHLDVSYEVQDGLDFLLFNLLVLGYLKDADGHVWRRSELDLYVIENMPVMRTVRPAVKKGEDRHYFHSILNILPSVTCHSPYESLDILNGKHVEDYHTEDQLFDHGMFRDQVFQRPFQYLTRLDTGRQLQTYSPGAVDGTEKDCLKVLLSHCGVPDPSWSELHHFVWFLNTQLQDFEGNYLLSDDLAQDLPGFKKLVLKFLIQMSKDFSTRSLNMSEESSINSPEPEAATNDENEATDDNRDLETFQMKRTWESSPHPYLFFNSDHMTFTFLGFYIDRETGNLIDQETNLVLEKSIMARNLFDALLRNRVPLQEDFDALPRKDKIDKLCQVMGVINPIDPDDTYELTTDNVKKIMAIYMRIRCDIPVIVMGETGCGKTRLVKFMCALQVPANADITNIILMKVHGGTTNADIVRNVKEAEKLAKANVEKFGKNLYTILFFDEANTTESIGLIKEIMCDKTMAGVPLELSENLKFVAACNPYRKHSEEFIKKLEQAGLGYHVDANKTADRMGRVPMRRLVYRVQPLPQSLLPLVWDFGQLTTEVEDLYIRQMVRRYIREKSLPEMSGLVEVASAVLTASQDYMRQQRDECSFVSLRDAERVLSVMSWFYRQSQGSRTLFQQMDEKLKPTTKPEQTLTDITRSLVLALGVCYHACLKNRDTYRDHVVKHFKKPYELTGGADQMHQEIVCCQDVFLKNVHLEKNIARNMALKENLFMMVVCIELRVPLFLVGKPGSSKSLAKTIVSDAMQGNAALEQLFKELKQVQMVSFQCSPLSTPDGIVGTFRQCAKFQQDKDLKKFVSIVVLDEVGLAEDSPRMPLKTLHPLLEDGCQGNEKPEPYMKVAFIGISNWALDPAKMNRGILVQREVPDIEELRNSAKGICVGEPTVMQLMENLIEPMANSYLDIFKEAAISREFFGLRDFYSLVKMVYSFVEKSRQHPTWFEMLHAIKRNFGGLDNIDPEIHFKKQLTGIVNSTSQHRQGDPDCAPAALIEACLFDSNKTDSESRYLLLLTENYGALSILQQQIIAKRNKIRPVIMFGSSFPSDQEYTQVCRNINKIKVCMETGNTVVLLNLDNLYESLYDALNQYYVYFGGERYVDLGLGTHRVKCRVHKNFRLIVVAEKQAVYDRFPIPLINRLEKHFLTTDTMLSEEQRDLVTQLRKWTTDFVKQKANQRQHSRTQGSCTVNDAFVGYHDDTCSALMLHVWQDFEESNKDDALKQILTEAKKLLLWCATPDMVVNLSKSLIPFQEQKSLGDCYFKEQEHDSLSEYLKYKLNRSEKTILFAQITTHSKLLASSDRRDITAATGIKLQNIMLENLQSFDTEQQFSNKIRSNLKNIENEASLLIVQCDRGNINGSLVASARYCVLEEYQKVQDRQKFPFHVVFIVQLPRIAGGCFTGFQCGIWHSAHIDDIRPSEKGNPTIAQMQTKSPGALFQQAVEDYLAVQERNAKIEPQEQIDDVEFAETEGSLADSTDEVIGRKSEAISGRDTPADKDVDAETTETKLGINVNAFLLSCLQTALSMVKDRDVDVGRTTKRVSLVLDLLQMNAQQVMSPFVAGVSRLIALLLLEKEKSNYAADRWVSEQAVTTDNVQKAGTFRRACIQVLESKVAPILAGIIAYFDTNHNLDLMKQTVLSWRHQLWLKILNSPQALQLKYEHLQSPTQQRDLTEMLVMTTSCEGHIFSADFPFSWLIFYQLEELLRTPLPESAAIAENETERKLQQTAKVFGKSALGKAILSVDSVDLRPDIVSSYLNDFVHFVYIANGEKEQACVCQSLEYMVAAKVAGFEGENNSLLLTLIYVHQAYVTLSTSLKYFRTMNVVWPECSSRLIDFKQDTPENKLFTEYFVLDALRLLIEDLEPSVKELSEPVRRINWLNKCNKYRPVIDKMMGFHGENRHADEVVKMSSASVIRARYQWSRVLAVKLFLEHVCVKVTDDKKITIKHCMPLFKRLGDETDFKQLKSLGVVEKFLKQCNKTAMATFEANREKCCRCDKILDVPPVILPCTHTYCENCLLESLFSGETKCSECDAEYPPDFNRTNSEGKLSAEIAKLKDYQKRCNSFFMDLVSQLCFADNSPPDDEVIDKLLDYIVCTIETKKTAAGQKIQLTKELTIFDSSIDPNPVFRSFLLQLLMKTSGKTVKENLQKYLTQAEGSLHAGDVDGEKHYIELCLMVMQSLEDSINQESEENDFVRAAKSGLHLAKAAVDSEEVNIDKLYALALIRSGLAVTASCINKAIATDLNNLTQEESGLIEVARRLCVEGNTEWPKIYLVKYLCRCYGVDIYQAVCTSQAPSLKWLDIVDLNRKKVIEGPDRYVVCGTEYTDVRETLVKVILGEEVEKLEETIQQTVQGNGEVYLALAIHREITYTNLYPMEKRRCSEKVNKYCQERKGKLQELTIAALQNSIGIHCPHLTVTEGQDFQHQGVQCILVHFLSVLHQLDTAVALVQPLIGLMKQPEQYTNSFLPTMPQDDLEEIKQYIIQAVKSDGDYNPVLYRCQNGHPYVVGNCGRAVGSGKCSTCNVQIGGVAYNKLVAGNYVDEGGDKTETGHCLGNADIGQVPAPERALSRVQCTCLRLITHMAMFLGASTNPQAVAGLIKPTVKASAVPQFLWEHIKADLSNLGTALSSSKDDVLLLVHSVIHKLMITQDQAGTDEEMMNLKTKKGRTEWEEMFSKTYLAPIQKDMETILKDGQTLVAHDKRLGSDPLQCMLYEIDTHQERINPNELQKVPSVWRYRTHITMEHLKREFDSKASTDQKGNSKYPVLSLFLQEEQCLQALRFIPNILKLHGALFQKFQRKLDKTEASTITVGTIQRDAIAGDETIQLIADFAAAWELTRNVLEMYTCPTDLGGVTVPKELCRVAITNETPVAVLLPTMKDSGLCSFAMLDYLLRKQNDFLHKYMKEANRHKESVSTVTPMKVTAAHLISFDPKQDILPMVLANCEYSFEVGKGTKIEYDFDGLERQLMDRFLFSKSRIDLGRVMKLDTMKYRTEFTNVATFTTLGGKLPQERLNSAVKHQISAEIQSIPDLYQSLGHLDIAISFLQSIGGDSEQNLFDFMSETLKIENPLLSQKANQECKFKHIQSLWMLLSFLRTKKMAEHKQGRQSMFESTPEEFYEDIPTGDVCEVDGYFREMSVEKLGVFIEVLHEFVVLRLSVKLVQDEEGFDDISMKKLGEWLYAYMDDQELDSMIVDFFPGGVLNKHAVNVWVQAYEMLQEKIEGRRR